MFQATFAQSLKADYQKRQQQRHELIRTANDVLRQAKQAIFQLHRGEIKPARTLLNQLNKTFIQLQKKVLKNNPELRLQGAYLAALEEYAEAEFFYQALIGESLHAIKNVAIGVEQNLAALADMTGELTRQAVLRATAKDDKTVMAYKTIAEDVVGGLMQFDLVSALRQKYDDAKRNLKRIEGICYDISLRR